MPPVKSRSPRLSPEAALREFALGFPGAIEEFPWGERVVKVRGKIFVFLGVDDGSVHLSVKLRASHGPAMLMGFVKPTGYGLGKAGWISARFAKRESVPLEMLRGWIEESYRLIAPKKLIAERDSR